MPPFVIRISPLSLTAAGEGNLQRFVPRSLQHVEQYPNPFIELANSGEPCIDIPATRVLSWQSKRITSESNLLTMPSVSVIRSQIERRIPGALTVYERATREAFPTGIPAIDKETGGIPKGALTQICAPAGITSGRTTLLLSLLAQVTCKELFCAVVDASDCFDPESANAMGVCLSRVLWVRCGNTRLKSIEQAFKAADILIQNGGFGVIAIDLGNVDEKLIRKIPLTTWFRFARVMKTMPTALVMLLSQFNLEIGRTHTEKPVQNTHANFSARSQ
jgi:hypothetical protein